MKELFCTVVSKYRLHQFVAMYHSLRDFNGEVSVFVLAVDRESKSILDAMGLPGLNVLAASELEDNELSVIKGKRKIGEYCWTLKPVLLLYLYERLNDFEIFCFIDSDLFFFDNLKRLFNKNKSWSVLLSTHKVNRKANGGFVAFRRSRSAHEALKWWKEKCMEWCYDSYDNGRFADQAYLDFMRKGFKGVCYVKAPGANVAPWNHYKYDYISKSGDIYVNGRHLIFYHFSGFRLKRIEGSFVIYGAEIPCEVCGAYTKAIRKAIGEIEAIDREAVEYFYMGV